MLRQITLFTLGYTELLLPSFITSFLSINFPILKLFKLGHLSSNVQVLSHFFVTVKYLTRYIGANILIVLLSVAWKMVVFSSTTFETGV